jgi:exodeoxyribonuclease VII large subunit
MFETSSEKPAPVRVVTEAIKEYLDRLGPIWIEGEISELNERSGGMAFMRLRDTSADMSLSVMCYKTVLASVQPLPSNARVVIHAKASWYTKSGTLTMSAKEIRQVGVGELLARLEELKSALAKEGLFNADRKVALPRLPHKVGLICGRNTDAMKDVVENARRRWPAVEFEIREVAVQGSAAVVEVSQALAELEADPDVDVIIITRGGGSFEDLLPFSDESLVRLAGSCLTPIVSAIGHEKDSPLLDLVADYRASTPTDAAKRVVPDIAQEIADIELIRQRLLRKVTHLLDFEVSTISHLTARPVMKDPMVIVTSRLDQISTARDRAARTMASLIDSEKRELKQVRAHLRSLSPQSTLDRGYAVATLSDGRIARKAKDVELGAPLHIRLAKGSLEATVERRVD